MPPIINTIVTLCGSFSCVCIAGGWLLKIWKGIKQPETNQNVRIAALEKQMAEILVCLDNDNHRIRSMEHGHRIILESLQALINHAIDNRNVDELITKSRELNTYLYDKGFKEQ